MPAIVDSLLVELYRCSKLALAVLACAQLWYGHPQGREAQLAARPAPGCSEDLLALGVPHHGRRIGRFLGIGLHHGKLFHLLGQQGAGNHDRAAPQRRCTGFERLRFPTTCSTRTGPIGR